MIKRSIIKGASNEIKATSIKNDYRITPLAGLRECDTGDKGLKVKIKIKDQRSTAYV
jgi:hypothetical protein